MASRMDTPSWCVARQFDKSLTNKPPQQLKYYGKGHLVNSFMEEPAERKLRGVEAVMDSFQTSKFILVGDSGEQE